MKNALIAAASVAALAAVVPAVAQAQVGTQAGAYANLNLGYADLGQPNLGVIQGRLGYRFNNWVGVEGELATGIKSDSDTVAGLDVNTKLKSAAAAYMVGFAPVNPDTDILARIGYGTTDVRARVAGISDSRSEESWNFGVGAQHRFDGVNGVRVDYTRQAFNHDAGHANVWTVGYTRRF